MTKSRSATSKVTTFIDHAKHSKLLVLLHFNRSADIVSQTNVELKSWCWFDCVAGDMKLILPSPQWADKLTKQVLKSESASKDY